jgi:hypothetical protein
LKEKSGGYCYYYFRSELEDIVSTFDVVRPGESYSLQGRTYRFQSARRQGEQGGEEEGRNQDPDHLTATKLLALHLGNALYQLYHCRKKEGEGAYGGKEIATAYPLLHGRGTDKSRDFIEMLSRANTGHGTWEPGWEIRKIERNGQLATYRDGLTLWISPKQFFPYDGDDDREKIEVGKKGYIAMVKEFRALLPGFYMANGNAPLDQTPPLVRIYWNVGSQDAALLMRVSTTELNDANVPFQFKILSDPNSFSRTDAGVLYISKQHLKDSRGALRNIYGRTKGALKPETSLFCKRLAPGVSLAEDPHNGESFGQHRTRILAEALCQAATTTYENDKILAKKEDRFNHVSAYLEKSGISMLTPYLNSGSIEDYDAILDGVFLAN